MITKNDIVKMTHHILRRSAGVPDHKIMHPERDWVIGLLIATIVFMSGAVYSGNKFVGYLNLIDEEVVADSTVVQYRQSSISAALGEYGERARKFEELRSDKVIIVVEKEELDGGDEIEVLEDGGSEESGDGTAGGLDEDVGGEETVQPGGEDGGLILE